MNFRTVLHAPAAPFQIDHSQKMFSIGSCFAANIGAELARRKFDIFVNPMGIVYNPFSIADSLKCSLQGYEFSEHDLFFHHDLWHSVRHHSSFSHHDKHSCLEKINIQAENARTALLKTDILLLTLGSAVCYKHLERGMVVANCHKLPATVFEKYRATVPEIVTAFSAVLKELLTIKPQLKIVMTLSPIRHLREGLHENQLSKATLLLAIEALAKAFPSIFYFPAYELLLDDLRDYRFYEKDMAHPNELARDYIWNVFANTFFATQTQHVVKEVEDILMATQHRSFNPQTTAHQQFLSKQLEKIDGLLEKMPHLDFEMERKVFTQYLL